MSVMERDEEACPFCHHPMSEHKTLSFVSESDEDGAEGGASICMHDPMCGCIHTWEIPADPGGLSE